MTDRSTNPLHDLLAIMARLRDPEHGCPWDLQQDFASVAPYTIEEAHEVADAIERGNRDDLRDELGDLLFQVVFHAQLASEAGWFDFDDVAAAISAKMRRRHPHVFGDLRYASVEEQKQAWDAIKTGISSGLPPWTRALKLQQRAGTVGFEWPAPEPILDKLAEEVEEVRAEFASEDFAQGANHARLEDEIGDVLFVLVNLARRANVDFLRALRGANAKFERRFRRMEVLAAGQGRPLAERSLDEQEALWRQAKADETG
jgi:ATP diphosphatase